MFIGKARSYEIIEHRKKIMKALTDSPKIVKLLGKSDSEYPEDEIPYKLCYPHEYKPETTTTTERYINFDMKANMDSKNDVYKDITIWFFVTCHQNVIKYVENGETFLWYDMVVCEVDDIFTGNNVLGIGGTTSLISNDPYCPQTDFKGRILTFKIKDFSNGLRYGK